jgi:hypothetical protein
LTDVAKLEADGRNDPNVSAKNLGLICGWSCRTTSSKELWILMPPL